MGKHVRTSAPRGLKSYFRLPRSWSIRSRDVGFRRARLFVEWLEDRSTPSATPFDPLDARWLMEQQIVSLRSDIGQIRELTTACSVSSVFDANVPALAAPRHEVILVDARVPDLANFISQLEEGLPPGAWYDLYVIDATHGGVSQITDILAQYHHNLDAVHLFSHGSSGELLVGSDQLDRAQLSHLAGQLSTWNNALINGGDLLLYGCDVAAGADGEAFVEQLHVLTGLDVAASTDETGAAVLGGDWILETHLGEIGSAPLHLADRADAWSGLLNFYDVTNTNNSGLGSFRQALLDANAHAGLDTIRFQIAGAGVHVIQPDSQLPTITDTVVIDGSTQFGYLDQPLIVLDGINATNNGLVLAADDSTIRGLNFIRWANDGIQIHGNNNFIAGVYSGIDATGTFAQANHGDGLEIKNGASGNIIGGVDPLDRNIFSGNDSDGIELENGDSNQIVGNILGADATGTFAVANGDSGVRLWTGSANNMIGGASAGEGNIIAFNADAGILMLDAATVRNRIFGNAIFQNVGLGIDLSALTGTGDGHTGDGVTLNDSGDPDSGPNYLKNFPVLSAATTTGTSITIAGSLNSVAVGSYRIEFFANDTADASGYGQGQRYLGFITVTTDASGNVSFSATFAAAVSAGAAISATNTDLGLQSTSEFAANVIVTSANSAPVIVSNGGGAAAAVNVAENTTFVTTVAATDADNDPLVYALAVSPDQAFFTINSAGVLRFQGPPNFEGPADANGDGVYVVVVQVSDGQGGFVTQTIAVTVTDVNEGPTAVGEAYAVNEGGTLTISPASVLGNDSDPDGDTLTALLVAGAVHGSLTLNSDGTFTYIPVANYYGADSFTYQAFDGALLSNIVIVSLTINAVNDAPVANDDAYSLSEGGTLNVTPAAGVLANDSDIDSANLTAVLVAGPSHGTLNLNSDGSFTYTADPNYNGSDSFTYQAFDGALLSNVVTVSLTINAVNDAPVASDDAYTLSEGATLNVAPAAGVLANDSDIDSANLTAVLVAGPSHGTLNFNSDGSFTYTPAANYNGADSFTYQAFDGALLSNVVTVSLTINAVNDAPVANVDAYALSEDATLNVAPAAGVLANDSDIDSANLTAVLVAGPSYGTLNLNSDGSFTYTPAANYNGADSFTYQAFDGALLSNVVTVSLTINAVNDAPVASDDAYSLSEDATLNVAPAAGVLANDSDIDSANLTAVLVAGPSHGTLSLNSDGSFTYTPAANYNGADSFTYQASDGSNRSPIRTVTLSVAPVNDAPTLLAAAYALNEDEPLAVASPGLLAGAVDVDGDPLTAILVTGPRHGVVVLNANGTFTYSPAANYHGSDSFTFFVTDGQSASNNALVSLTIAAVNDAPAFVPRGSGALDYFVQQGSPRVFAEEDFLSFAVDADGDPLVPLVMQGPAHGTLTANADGSFTFTSHGDYVGADAFVIVLSDGVSRSQEIVVNLMIASDITGTPNVNLPQTPVPGSTTVLTLADNGPGEAAITFVSLGRGGSSENFGVGGGDEEAGSERVVRRMAANAPRGDFASAAKEIAAPAAAENVGRAEVDRPALDSRSSMSIAPFSTPLPSAGPRFVAQQWQQQAAQLFQNLDDLADNIAQHSGKRQTEALIVGGAAAVISGGYVLWSLRTFYVLLGALTARPLWRTFDPLLILDRWDKRQDDDDVEKMFD